VKPPRLSLPSEVAPLVASTRRISSDPPEEIRDELRARLGWAFIENGPAKVVYAPEHQPLRAVPPSARGVARWDRWLRSLAQAAAAMVVGHVPLALATLGVAVAAVPVSKIVLNRVAQDGVAAHATTANERRAAHPPPAPAVSHAPPILVLPSLAPLPTPFPLSETTNSQPPSAVQPVAARVAPSAPGAPIPSETPNDDVALAAERQLLEQARLALVRGDAIGALASLNEHRARYPNSQIAEERDALSIKALLRAGRVGDARLRGVEFRRQFPNSLLLPALDAALHE
jgi:hypothetical protein